MIHGIINEGKNRGIEVDIVHLVGNMVKSILEEAENNHTMILLSASLIDEQILLSNVENIIRFSKIPLQLVPVGITFFYANSKFKSKIFTNFLSKISFCVFIF